MKKDGYTDKEYWERYWEQENRRGVMDSILKNC